VSFDETYDRLRDDLLREGANVDTGQWQSQSDVPHTQTVELQFVTVMYEMPLNMAMLQQEVQPNLPWAEEHFQERVSGVPYNPPPSATRWPFTQRNHEEHTDEHGRFSHTYPERMWPIEWDLRRIRDTHSQRLATLHDLVTLFIDHPGTRQGYFPIWWPNDGHWAGKERVPCTLGYHFIIRDGEMHCHYFMRSCDFLRHFRDDVYMACRLTQWLCTRIYLIAGIKFRPCRLVMPITSLHVFEPDIYTMKYHLKTEGHGH
jgi:thymidylate synthase